MDDEDARLERSRTYVADTEHVRILSILHYVSGGLQLFNALSGLVFVGMGFVIAGGQFAANNPNERAAMQFMGSMFLIIGSIVVTLNALIGGALFYAGYCLGQWRNHTYCFVIAVLECLAIPLGTLLGVFTIVVLQRETVKDRFAGRAATMD